MRTRLATFVLLIPVSLTAFSGNGRAATVLPTASCFDAKYFDGLETQPSATYCRNAVVAAGYKGAAYHNVSAKQEMGRVATDGVFFFNGHALVAGASSLAAISLEYEFQGPAGPDFDFLVGEPTGLEIQGPLFEICNETGTVCRNTSIKTVSYPWVNLLGKHNLVVLEACNTAGTNTQAPLSMTSLAHFSGVGTVIGFRNFILCPVAQSYVYCIKWAGVFWGDLQAGIDYTTATVAASNSVGDGFLSYVIQKNPLAPTRLRPAKYYPAGGLSVGAANSLGRSLSSWLGRGLGSLSWRASSVNGQRTGFQTYLPGTGLFELDAISGDVTQAVFSNELFSSGKGISRRLAKARAENFAANHYAGFRDLTVRSTEYIDHGDFREYRFVWQQRLGAAWTPQTVAVGVNATTGRIASYSAERRPLAVGVKAALTSREALTAAVVAAGFEEKTMVLSGPALEVKQDETGLQHLVWVTDLMRSQSGIFSPARSLVWTDAFDGATRVVARS